MEGNELGCIGKIVLAAVIAGFLILLMNTASDGHGMADFFPVAVIVGVFVAFLIRV